MTAADTLYALHARLVRDTAKPLTSDGTARSVRPTPAGRAWLSDYDRYRRILRTLHDGGQNPHTLLHDRFGCVLDSELETDEPHDNGRSEGDKPTLTWYVDTLKEECDGPEAA